MPSKKADINITGASRVARRNPLEIRKSTDVEQPTAALSKPAAIVATPPQTKKVGRPRSKTEDCKKVNIAIPVSVLEKLDIAKESYHGNLTEYINVLINKDMAVNFEKYKETYDMLNKLGRV